MHKYIELYYAIRDDDVAIPYRRISNITSALMIACRETTVLELAVDRHATE